MNMDAQAKFRQGTAGWFEMMGTLMCEAALHAGLTLDFNLTLVERYTDGVELAGGHVQGIRFDIINGQPSFRIGVRRDERGDVTIEITARAARALNVLRSCDPDYQTASRFSEVGRDEGWRRSVAVGEMVHDLIVERTI
ncbi:hypothetical protein [Rhizobium leguminosarum]|uniref:hypothetical protein n=1 Tax=Rhizobium leguminosarum TaxID=384 RepID=UPI001C973710|nr:hypothetical protein [Rhizobium leguminosarum]